MPASVELTVKIDVAEPPELTLTLVGLREVVRPDGDDETVRDMVPVKLFRLVRVTVDVAEAPVCTETVVGLAAMLKSLAVLTVTEIVTEWVRDPLVPVTITV